MVVVMKYIITFQVIVAKKISLKEINWTTEIDDEKSKYFFNWFWQYHKIENCFFFFHFPEWISRSNKFGDVVKTTITTCVCVIKTQREFRSKFESDRLCNWIGGCMNILSIYLMPIRNSDVVVLQFWIFMRGKCSFNVQ